MKLKKRALGNGLSDIGRFSLAEPNLEGIRRSRNRGLIEHGLIDWSGLWMSDDNRVVRTGKHAEFRRAEKFGKGMALRI